MKKFFKLARGANKLVYVAEAAQKCENMLFVFIHLTGHNRDDNEAEKHSDENEAQK
jgi:hypothetical protein